MTSRRTLGSRFENIALGPVAFGATALRSGHVDRALAELSAESLWGGVVRAIDAVARDAGVAPAVVKDVLPIGEADAVLARIEPTAAEAASQWSVHMQAAGAGSLLEAVAKLTADSRPAEAGPCLMRLATKMKLEKSLALPLRRLAEQMDAWVELLASMRERLDDGSRLEAARRRRRIRRLAGALAAAVAIVAAGAYAARVRSARRRIDALVAAADPCEIELCDAADLAHATGEQAAAVAMRHSACQRDREQAERAEAERRRAAEQLERAQAEKRAREQACRDLGKAIASAQAWSHGSQDGLAAAGSHAGWFGRVARRQLEAGDVTADLGALPCLQGASGDAIAGAFAAAAAGSAGAWLGKHAPSRSALQLLGRGKAAPAGADLARIARAADRIAENALMTGDAERLSAARGSCALLGVFALSPGVHCQALAKLR